MLVGRHLKELCVAIHPSNLFGSGFRFVSIWEQIPFFAKWEFIYFYRVILFTESIARTRVPPSFPQAGAQNNPFATRSSVGGVATSDPPAVGTVPWCLPKRSGVLALARLLLALEGERGLGARRLPALGVARKKGITSPLNIRRVVYRLLYAHLVTN